MNDAKKKEEPDYKLPAEVNLVETKRKKHNGKEQRPRLQIVFTEPTRTKQEFKEECDVNSIMGRARAIQRMQDPNLINNNYGDAEGYDFHEAMNYVTAQQQKFDALPSDVRARFHNDPGELIDFVGDPENKEELRKMGLLTESAIAEMDAAKAAKAKEKEASQPKPKPPEGEKGDKEGVT